MLPAQAEELLSAGADVITMGNHTWGRRELVPYLERSREVLRPANLPQQQPGRGWGVFETPFGDVAVIDLIGRCGMDYTPDNPFQLVERILRKIQTKLILVELHAEATSEKLAMGRMLDGQVSAVWGTHTHVPTADTMILPQGTGYVTDLGMTGPRDSVLGIRPELSIRRFRGDLPSRYEPAPGNHDALLPGSPYLENGWPENVHIFRTAEPERVSLPEFDVYGAGFLRAEMPAMLDGFRAADPSRLNILVLHGDAENPASPYDPVSSAALAASGLDYAALGHIHRRGERRDGGTLCAWPGCLMGRGFDECGEKGALLVSAEKGACRTEFVPCGARRYERLSVPAGDDALAAVRAALTPELEGSCCRIELTGEAAPVDLAALQAALEPQFFSLDLRDRTRPKQDLWEACGEDTLRGHFLDGLHAQFEAAETDERRQVVARAARLGLALMDGREVPL